MPFPHAGPLLSLRLPRPALIVRHAGRWPPWPSSRSHAAAAPRPMMTQLDGCERSRDPGRKGSAPHQVGGAAFTCPVCRGGVLANEGEVVIAAGGIRDRGATIDG